MSINIVDFIKWMEEVNQRLAELEAARDMQIVTNKGLLALIEELQRGRH